MKDKHKRILLIFISLLISSFGFSQSNKIEIKFLGNCGLYMTDGGTNIYVDFPYKSGAHRYMEYDESELDSINSNSIFLFTHRHTDHYSKKIVKNFDGKKYGNWNVAELEELNASISDFSIKGFKTSHKFTSKHFAYLITWHNKKIYINGDTGDAGPIGKIEEIDWVFAPYWLYLNAKEEKLTIDAEKFGLYHIAPVQVNGIDKNDWPENFHFFTKKGEIIEIPY